MNPIKFVKEHLDDVAEVHLLAKNATSFLVAIIYTDGRKEQGIVYPPTDIRTHWDMEVGQPNPSRARYGNRVRECRCDDVPSPIEQILEQRPATTWQPESGSCIDEPEDGVFAKPKGEDNE